MSNKVMLEGLYRTLQDLMDSKEAFGGKVIILAGDFRQLPTVIKHGTRAQTVSASLKRSELWHNFKTLSLKENMRIKNSGNHPKLIEWDNWLQKCGDGELHNIEGADDYITLKQEMCSEIDNERKGKSVQDAIFFTYGDIKTQSSQPQWTEFASERAILASRCKDVNCIKRKFLQHL